MHSQTSLHGAEDDGGGSSDSGGGRDDGHGDGDDAGIAAAMVGMMVLGVGMVMTLARECAARTKATNGSPRGSLMKLGSARDATAESGMKSQINKRLLVLVNVY